MLHSQRWCQWYGNTIGGWNVPCSAQLCRRLGEVQCVCVGGGGGAWLNTIYILLFAQALEPPKFSYARLLCYPLKSACSPLHSSVAADPETSTLPSWQIRNFPLHPLSSQHGQKYHILYLFHCMTQVAGVCSPANTWKKYQIPSSLYDSGRGEIDQKLCIFSTMNDWLWLI